MATTEELIRLMDGVSSSSATPVSSSSFIPFGQTPLQPNTTTEVKSSSTAPEQTEMKPANKTKTKNIAKKKKQVQSVQEIQTVPVTEMEKYTPQQQSEQTDATSPTPETQNWFTTVQPNQQVEPQKSIHTLFQTLTGRDAIPYGQKWQWYLENGFTGMHGGLHNELMRQVEAERGMGGQQPGTYGQELRAKEQKRRTLMDQWNRLLNEWNQGRYSGDEENVRYFYNVANQLRAELEAEGVNPNTLRPPSLNAGGFAQGFQKALQEDRSKLDWIGGWLNDIQQNVAKDPNWLNGTQAQMYFDKLSEYTILNWAQSKGAIADAEKVRAQVESMPREDRAVYDKFMNMFFNSNLTAQLQALADAGNYDAKTTLQQQYKFLQLGEDNKGYAKYDKQGNYLGPSDEALKIGNSFMHALKNIVRSNNQNIPINLTAGVTSFKNSLDAFQNYVMQNANVDREMVWNSAVGQYNIYKDMYNRKLPQLGLSWGWGHKGPQVDQNFGSYLKRWQSTQQAPQVMANARLANRALPKEQTDPTAKGSSRGGVWWRN